MHLALGRLGWTAENPREVRTRWGESGQYCERLLQPGPGGGGPGGCDGLGPRDAAPRAAAGGRRPWLGARAAAPAAPWGLPNAGMGTAGGGGGAGSSTASGEAGRPGFV